MFCKNCGAQMQEDAAFCPKCGAAAEKEQKFLPRKQRRNGAFQKDEYKSCVRKTAYLAWKNSAVCD